ncbi:MAG: M18 family aminopeptidase [Coprococcus sp.]
MENMLFDYLNNCVTQFHTIAVSEEILQKNGYKKLEAGSEWKLSQNEKYYVVPYGSMLVAFSLGKEVEKMRIGIAHTDFPCLKLKSNPDMIRAGYHMANVEPYGGLIMETWFDRPLGLAGKVVLKGENPFEPKVELYKSNNALFIIPSLAPHLRKDDKAGKLDSQKELIPIYNLEKNENIIDILAADMKLDAGQILDYDLYLYNMDKAAYIGTDENMISSPRIDDISSVAALMEMSSAEPADNCMNIIALFDNEEIGSRSKQGADSVLLGNIIDRILKLLGATGAKRDYIYNHTFMLSLDVAHGIHPNYTEKADPTNSVKLGDGVVLKTSAGQRYVTDSEASAVVMALAEKYDIKVQRQVNKSGMAGGQTLGPIISSYIPVMAVDMGIPVLAMHSSRELASMKDYRQLCNLIEVCFTC